MLSLAYGLLLKMCKLACRELNTLYLFESSCSIFLLTQISFIYFHCYLKLCSVPIPPLYCSIPSPQNITLSVFRGFLNVLAVFIVCAMFGYHEWLFSKAAQNGHRMFPETSPHLVFSYPLTVSCSSELLLWPLFSPFRLWGDCKHLGILYATPVITQHHVPNQISIDCAGNFFVCQFSVPHRVYWPGCIVQFYLVLCHAVYKITAMRGFSQELPCL